MARDSIPDELDLDINQPEILRAILAGVLATGDVIGHDEAGRVVLAWRSRAGCSTSWRPWMRIWKTSSRRRTRTTTRARTRKVLYSTSVRRSPTRPLDLGTALADAPACDDEEPNKLDSNCIFRVEEERLRARRRRGGGTFLKHRHRDWLEPAEARHRGRAGTSLLAAGLLLVGAAVAGAEELRGAARVQGGDTLAVADEKVRLLDVDAPELAQRCEGGPKKLEACGKLVAEGLAGKLAGETVICRGDERDDYDRLLARCSLNGEDLSTWLVEQGWGLACRRYSTRLIATEDTAKAAKRGLWRTTLEPSGNSGSAAGPRRATRRRAAARSRATSAARASGSITRPGATASTSGPDRRRPGRALVLLGERGGAGRLPRTPVALRRHSSRRRAITGSPLRHLLVLLALQPFLNQCVLASIRLQQHGVAVEVEEGLVTAAEARTPASSRGKEAGRKPLQSAPRAAPYHVLFHVKQPATLTPDRRRILALSLIW